MAELIPEQTSEQTPEKGESLNLYQGKPQHEVFCRMKEVLPTTRMKPSDNPFQFPEGKHIELPATFEFENTSRSSVDFLNSTDTSALLVLKDGQVRHEQYWLTGGREVQWISWSMAKSFLATMVGIAVQEGSIESIDQPITHYVKALRGSAYDGVRIKDILQMSSGARWNEDYSDSTADVHRLGAVMAGESTLSSFVASIVKEREAGTLCQYNSADTQALGMLVVKATGRSISSYMQEKISEPLGMESAGYWLVDKSGMELVLGGLNLTARDFAKIGELYRNKGCWNGKQIVPENWVKSSVTPDSPHIKVGKVIVGGHILPLGYGYQWWVPEGDRGEFSAIGVYNQFVFVDPSRELVIVKLSANRSYGTTPNEAENQEMETIEFLRAVAKSMD